MTDFNSDHSRHLDDVLPQLTCGGNGSAYHVTTSTVVWPTWVGDSFSVTESTVLSGSGDGSSLHDPTVGSWRSWVNGVEIGTSSSISVSPPIRGTSGGAAWRIWIDGIEVTSSPGFRPDFHVDDANVEVSRAIRQRDLRSRLEMSRRARTVRTAARSLLRSILTEGEWLDWRLHESVRVVGSLGGVYEIGCRGWTGMIHRIGVDGIPTEKLCCHPPSCYPPEDRVATLVLALRTDEGEVLRKANRHRMGEEERRRVAARRLHRAVA